MKVTALQTDIVWGDTAANLHNAAQLMSEHPGSDLYVLPEMFSTGFTMTPEIMADKTLSTLRWMQRQVEMRQCALVGSVAAEDGGQYFNRTYFVCPDGTYTIYDKHHLFTPSGEDRHYRPGNKRQIVVYKGWRILLQTCYDLRFPVFSRNTDDYDVAIYIASWPSSRLSAFTTLLHARAIENQAYVIGVNRIGSDPACRYSGGSEIVDALGATMATSQPDTVCAVTAHLDLDILRKQRREFAVLADADRFTLFS